MFLFVVILRFCSSFFYYHIFVFFFLTIYKYLFQVRRSRESASATSGAEREQPVLAGRRLLIYFSDFIAFSSFIVFFGVSKVHVHNGDLAVHRVYIEVLKHGDWSKLRTLTIFEKTLALSHSAYVDVSECL